MSEEKDVKNNDTKNTESDIEHINKIITEKPSNRENTDTKENTEHTKKEPIKKEASKKIISRIKSNEKKSKILPSKIVKKKTKTENKDKKEDKKKKNLVWLWIVIVALIVGGISILLITYTKEKPVTKTTSEIAAIVNGEAIYLKDIDEQYNNLNPILQQVYTKEFILNQTIDELLLIQEAKNRNIIVKESEIDEEIANFKKQYSLSENDFKNVLEQQNLTLKELRELVKRRLLIKNFLNTTIFNNINISDESTKKYYEQNIEKFTIPEKVTVQHILILVNDNVTDTEAKNKIESIKKELNNSTFCDLVRKYSEDPGSKDTCGQYTFGRGEMVKEFEDASFELKINETKIVKTIYGYHLIKKISHNEKIIQSYEDVSEDIKNFLRDEAVQKNFESLLADLRAKATIINYLYKNTETNNNSVSKNLDDFAKCLTEKEVKMYGAYWCPHCENNKKQFGESWKYVTYVECAVEGQPQIQTQACIDANIEGYPTWIINGKKYPGEQSLATLARLTGCKLN
ncbi:MAG: peptidylprolyl isomerase [Candidatus Woesearchaeota archaeon]